MVGIIFYLLDSLEKELSGTLSSCIILWPLFRVEHASRSCRRDCQWTTSSRARSRTGSAKARPSAPLLSRILLVGCMHACVCVKGRFAALAAVCVCRRDGDAVRRHGAAGPRALPPRAGGRRQEHLQHHHAERRHQGCLLQCVTQWPQ